MKMIYKYIKRIFCNHNLKRVSLNNGIRLFSFYVCDKCNKTNLING